MRAAFLPLLWLASGLFASETHRIGGSGGRRTVTMDCGAGAFIIGARATAGRDGFGFNLVRKIRFTCQAFTGTTATGTKTQTAEAVADHEASLNITAAWGDCTAGRVVESFEFSAASFIDRLTSARCIDGNNNGADVAYNAGGEGGDRAFLACPQGEALFKIEARVGDAIDSLKGYCRAFTAPPPPSVPQQITASRNPRPTSENPLVVPLRESKTISFKLTDVNAVYSTSFVGVMAETDLLGGSGLNPPEFKLELLNPSGSVVASQTFTSPRGLAEVSYHFNVNGTWKLRITNLKKDVGFLNVISFDAHAP